MYLIRFLKAFSILSFLLVITSCDMGFFFKSKAEKADNPYAGYDAANQLRPNINAGDFYRMKDFEFGWLLLEPINISESKASEPTLAARF